MLGEDTELTQNLVTLLAFLTNMVEAANMVGQQMCQGDTRDWLGHRKP